MPGYRPGWLRVWPKSKFSPEATHSFEHGPGRWQPQVTNGLILCSSSQGQVLVQGDLTDAHSLPMSGSEGFAQTAAR